MEVSVLVSSGNIPPLKTADANKEKNRCQRLFQSCCPNGKQMNRYISQTFLVLFLYAVLYGMLGEGALPGSYIFALFVLVICAFIGGKLMQMARLPGLVGMLLVGFAFRNIKANPLYDDIPHEVITNLREIALSVILFRAGVGLDGEALNKLKYMVLRLTVCPCLTEVISMGIFGHYILGLPFIFSFMLGFIISSISPEVVLPSILEFERQSYGVSKGIPALIIGATSLDDILAIAGFTICFSIAFSTRDLVWTMIKAPLEPIIGLIFAVLFGVLFWYFPSGSTRRGILVYYNVTMVFFGSMAAMFLSHRLNMAGAGPLTCIILGFVASLRWRKDGKRFLGVYESTLLLWEVVEPVLFSLIGSEITLEVLKENAGWAILALILSLSFRTIMTFFITFGINLNLKEKIFVCCAYLPKASVQAAIGSQALDYARKHNYPDELVEHGYIVLNVCVLSLMLTAPLAAILIHNLGPVLLTKESHRMSVIPEKGPDPVSDEEEAVNEGKRVVADYSKVSLIRRGSKDKRNT